MFSAWQEVVQEVVQQEQGPEAAQGAVHYKETTPSPHMDSEYSSILLHPPSAAHVFRS